MLKTKSGILSAVSVAWLITAAASPVQGADETAAGDKQQQLIAVLQSDAPKADKAITCKQLAVYGTAESVPAIAALLPDPELTSWARIALEAIPDPAADAALRDALGSVQGRTLVGVINSIGVRRDPLAVQGLAPLLKNTDPAVASSAAVALGRIGDAEATRALRTALADTNDDVRSAVAEGCILCAEQRWKEDQADEAAALYDQVRQADVSPQRIVEATRGAILARGSEGIPLLVEQLRSPDKKLLAIGLSTARELVGEGVSQKLVDALDALSPDRQALVILALADRGDTAALPAMLQAAAQGDPSVRIAAIRSLQQIGNASCVPALLAAAEDADADVAAAAQSALQGLPGDDVDAELVQRLKSAEGASRRVLIQLVGLRRIAAVPSLRKAVDDPDPTIRHAALAALGETIAAEDLPILLTRLVTPEDAEDVQPATQALRTACVRMPDQDACAAKLADTMPRASVATQGTLLEILAAMGGPKAVETVGAVATSEVPELQDTASRLLGSWMTVDAGPVLLQLATDPEYAYRTRALRGYLRLARQFLMPEDQRVEICRKGLELADRDDERKLVLEIIERHPSVEMLRLAVDMGKSTTLKNQAAAAAMSVAQKIGGSANVQSLLAQIDQEPVKIEVIRATYGADSTQKDVTEIVRKYVGSLPLIVLPSSSYNSALRGDPVPGVAKQLTIEYRMDGKPGKATFAENATISLPVPD